MPEKMSVTHPNSDHLLRESELQLTCILEKTSSFQPSPSEANVLPHAIGVACFTDREVPEKL